MTVKTPVVPDRGKTSSKEKIKGDAAGAFAPSQGDSHNDGVHSADPSGDRDATQKTGDHWAPKPK